MLPAVRKALAFAEVLRRSGFRSFESRIILILAAALWRERGKTKRVRRDRDGWRQVASIAMEKPGEK
jgi:uncharacterized membrane protein